MYVTVKEAECTCEAKSILTHTTDRITGHIDWRSVSFGTKLKLFLSKIFHAVLYHAEVLTIANTMLAKVNW